MKKTLLASVVAITFGLSGPLMADHHGDKKERYMERLTEKLELTPEQQEEVRTIHKEQYEKHKAVREEGKARMDQTLTPEQRERMEELREEKKEKMKDRKSKHGGSKDKDSDS